MKKFYLFMMTLLVSMSAMAWTVKYTNPSGWGTVYAYCFGGDAGEALGEWPGKAMTKAGDVWTVSCDAGNPGGIIFNNGKGSGTNQTKNLTFSDGATYDNNGPIGVTVEKECFLVGPAPLVWGNATDGYKFTKQGDVYKLHIDAAPAELKCKVQYGAECLTTTDELVSGTTYGLYNVPVGGEMNLGGLTNIDLTFADPDQLTITFGGTPTPTPEGNYGLHGQIFGDTNWSSEAMTKNADGTWQYSGAIVAGQFGVKIYNTDVNDKADQTDWIGGAATVTEANKVYSFVKGDNSSTTLSGEYTIIYDPANQTIKFVGSAQSFEKIWVAGTMTDWELAKDGYEMTTTDGNIYTFHFDKLESTVMFKFVTGSTWEDLNYGTGNTAMENGVECQIYASGGDMGVKESLTDVTVTFNRAAETVKIEGTPVGGPAPVIELYVIGDFNSWVVDWPEANKMTRDGNVYTYVFEQGINGKFKVSGKNWAPNFGAGETQDFSDGKAVEAWYNSSNDFVYTTTKKATVTFTLADNYSTPGVASSIKIDEATSGIESVELEGGVAPVYYNLQGVRVMNPENGIFIEVRGNKAAKVVK